MEYPDILDLLGKTPRELGAIHLFAEPVPVSGDGRAVATLWLQAAYSGPCRGTLEVTGIDASGEPAIAPGDGRFELPDLSDGKVVRWRLALRLRGRPNELLLRVAAPPEKGAARVRPPWKLFDTIEQPKEARRVLNLGPSEGAGVLHAILHAATGHLMGALLSLARDANSFSVVEQGTPGVVHKARELLEGFVAPVISSDALPEPSQEVVWAPGRPVPEPVASTLPPVPPAPLPEGAPAPSRTAWWRCRTCGEELERSRADALGICPGCGAAVD